MNAKTKLEAVPTNAQLLREAIARRNATARELEAIRTRPDHFAPIEAEVHGAEAELQAVLQRDAAAMSAWVSDGAIGPSPEPDHKAREVAARKVTDARAKLSATSAAKSQIQADTEAAHQRHQEALKAVHEAELAVLGQELLRSAQVMKDASLTYLAAEQHYFTTRGALFDLDAARATSFSEQAATIGAPMNVQQEREFAQQAHAKSQQRLAALRAGQEIAE